MSPFPHITFRPRISIALIALGALTTAASLTSPTVASAAQPHEIPVHYNLRDLSTDRGVRALNGHIVVAARMVCPPEDPRKLWELAPSIRCQRQAIARAVAKIGNPRLSAMYAHRVVRQKASLGAIRDRR